MAIEWEWGDIAAYHTEKTKRRIGALLELADSLGLPPHQARLRRLSTAPDRPGGSFA